MRSRSSSRGSKEEVKIAKAAIPKALREQVWLTYAGRVYERRCRNVMSVFDFHVGHDIPESQGGLPICDLFVVGVIYRWAQPTQFKIGRGFLDKLFHGIAVSSVVIDMDNL